MRICASFGDGCDTAELEKADMIEIRTDLVPMPESLPAKPLLMTFKGGSVKLPKGFRGIVDNGEIPFVKDGVESLCSYHNFLDTPDESDIFDTLNSFDSDIVKGVFTPNDLNDLNTIRNVSVSMTKRHVIFGMQELGKITRIRQDILGNEFTFAHSGKPTAPGQLSVSETKRLDGCMITGIVGHPLDHTLSPVMHNAAFSKLKINGIYLEFDTPNLNGFKEFIVNYDVRGVNVTIPYKTEIMGHLDKISPEADRIGAVNTVVNDSGTLKGTNTDIFGIEHAFDGTPINGKRALVLGSGGAARACLYVMNKIDCSSVIASRNDVATKKLSRDFGSETIDLNNVDLSQFDVIINCTPVGMKGFPAGPPVSTDGLGKEHVVFDMVYGNTVLTDVARKSGAKIISGKDMLASQGARSFELWTGAKVSTDIMRKVI